MNRMQEQRSQKPPKEAYDEDGCSVCGAHVSSSFRRCPTTRDRLCNSCHCKAYRLKRKLGQPTIRGGGGSSQRRRPASAGANSPPPPLPTPRLTMQLHMQVPMHDLGGCLALDASDAAVEAAALWPSPIAAVGGGAAAPPLPGASYHEGSDVDVQVPAGLPLGGGELASAGCYGSGTLNPSVNLDASAAAAAGPQLLPHGLPSPGAPGRSADSQGQQHSGGSIGACAAPPPLLPDLQQRALHQSCATPADATLLLCCARRAQQATPGHADHRVVMGVLPSVQLHLPDDPPGLMHTTSVLLEAVAPPAPAQAEHSGDSQDQGMPWGRAGTAGTTAGEAQQQQVAVRLTVFASAGAVACWHEGPAAADLPLDFCPFTKAPTWQSGGPAGFSLRFPHAFCPQVDLMAAAHRHVALLGALALRQPPTLSLAPAPAPAAHPLPRHGSAALLGDAAAAAAAAAAGRQGQLEQQPQQQQQRHSHGCEPLHLDALQLSFGPLASDPLLPHGTHAALPCLSIFEM